MKRIVVLGGGISGYGSAILAKKQGFEVFLSDAGRIAERFRRELDRWEVPYEEGSHTEARILAAGEVVKSPGIPETAPIVQLIRARKIPVISEIEFAGRYLGGARTVCVTGSNGKTTTTSLIYKILRDAGMNVALGGNIGESFAYSVATGQFDWYVLELSSFQLDGMYRFRADVAVLMNITPDHLDRYDHSFERYADAKMRITQNQRARDCFIYSADDEVIRRELYTRPGELYNQSLLFQAIRTLGSMGHFTAEAIAPDIQPVVNSDELVDINWPLEEIASDQFQIAGGWGGGTFVGSVGVTLNNLSIKNFFKKGAWRPYPMGQNQRLSISAQTNGTYYKAFAISFTDPWMGGRKPNSFTISAHYSDENNAYYAWQKGTRYFRTAGVAAGLGKRLDWPDPYFTFYAEASYERYMLKDWNTFVLKNGAANLLSIRLVLGRNSVDQPIYPRRGSDFSVSVQLTPPYSLWDGKDYKSTALSEQERYNWIEFHKWMLKGQWFTPLTRNGNLVLMARAEMGYLGHYNKNKVSPFERFEVGGDGMTGYNMYGIDIISMRGYDDGALDPVGSNYSCAYNKYTMELRYPLLLKGQTNIYVLGFLEGGNGFTSWKEFSPFKIKRSAGIGVRLFLPVVGMMGVDWGWGFDPAAGQTKRSGSHIHFTMGMQF